MYHGLEFAQQHVQHELEQPGHIDAVDLCWCLHDLAMQRYGEGARDQLGTWNVRTTRDFGELVCRFIQLGHIKQTGDDSIKDFNDVFDFDQEFRFEDYGTTLSDG